VDWRSDGCGGGGPGRQLSSRVHSGPGVINEEVRDLVCPSQNEWLRMHVSAGRWWAHQRQTQRAAALRRHEPGRGFPAPKTCTRGCYEKRGSLRTHLEVQGEGLGVHGGRRRKGAERPRRRAATTSKNTLEALVWHTEQLGATPRRQQIQS
jgi:hypothetical protein